jgi:hypothetical protein
MKILFFFPHLSGHHKYYLELFLSKVIDESFFSFIAIPNHMQNSTMINGYMSKYKKIYRFYYMSQYLMKKIVFFIV